MLCYVVHDFLELLAAAGLVWLQPFSLWKYSDTSVVDHNRSRAFNGKPIKLKFWFDKLLHNFSECHQREII